MNDRVTVCKGVVLNGQTTSTNLHSLISNASLTSAPHVDRVSCQVSLREVESIVLE